MELHKLKTKTMDAGAGLRHLAVENKQQLNMNNNKNSVFVVLFCLVFAAGGVQANEVTPPDAIAPVLTLHNPNGANFDDFGAAVALSGDGNTLLVGAPETIAYTVSGNAAQVGRAYLFKRGTDGFVPQPSLVIDDPDPQQLDEFGARLAISKDGSTLLISASGGDSSLPRVYIFAGDTGAVLAVLESPDGGSDCFGQSLALSGDGGVALVGADCATVSGLVWAGKVYVFVREQGNWPAAPSAVLTEPAPARNDFFGVGVALSADGRTALIGSDNYASTDPVGRAYVFSRTGSGWFSAPEAVLKDPTATPGNMFGSSVALSGDGTTALVGTGNSSSGKEAHVFEQRNGSWFAAGSFDTTTAQTGSGFVNTVRLSADGRTALVGLLTGTGMAQMFKRSSDGNWPRQATRMLNDPAAANGDNYGWSAALSADGSQWVIGSPYAISHPSPAGSLFSSLPGPGMVHVYDAQSGTNDSDDNGGSISPAVLLLCILLKLLNARSSRRPFFGPHDQ